MKKILAFSVLALFLIPTIAVAAVFRADANVPQNEVILGNVYLGGGSPVIAGTVQGDLYVGGGTIVITGVVEEDAVLAGGNITITGTVGGDLRAFGGTVTIDGRVDGEIIVSGGSVVIGPNAIVRKDLVAMGGSVEVHPNAQIFGSSKVMTDEKEEEEKEEAGSYAYLMSAGFWVTQIFVMISTLVIAAIFMGICPNFIRRIVKDANRKEAFWRPLGVGSLFFIMVPIVALLLMVTAVGAVLGVALFLVYTIVILISGAFASIIFGGFLKAKFAGKKKMEYSWKWIILGIITLHLIGIIPYIGGPAFFMMVTYAVGILLMTKWKIMRAIK